MMACEMPTHCTAVVEDLPFFCLSFLAPSLAEPPPVFPSFLLIDTHTRARLYSNDAVVHFDEGPISANGVHALRTTTVHRFAGSNAAAVATTTVAASLYPVESFWRGPMEGLTAHVIPIFAVYDYEHQSVGGRRRAPTISFSDFSAQALPPPITHRPH
ncbi:hypothetical protein LSCM4_01323 [Leishmania orientalis]|uniref:Uncharacterized protein n=1 Tax=Leishmania orientalis TaxID=2249476 RepID=A0A836G6A2_9TRYP|nr:hypothetical protein LSCM4_01323 [Leishmania orientalis]